MGCAASGFNRTIMMFTRSTHNSQEYQATLQRKLYIAKESPEPDFDLSGCNLRQLPSGIFSICKVFRKEYIYLQNNKLKTLEEGGQLSDLFLIKILDISQNNFSQLPNGIRFLSSLTELYLQDNNLHIIPDEIRFLSSLRILNVSRNQLRQLCDGLGFLKNLRKLFLEGNKDLKELCVNLCNASNLIFIELDCEHIHIPPPEVTSKGTEEIMKFLCLKANVEYVPPSPIEEDKQYPSLEPSDRLNLFMKQKHTWEVQEDSLQQIENKLHKANQKQREQFLSNVLQDQLHLDKQIAKVHGDKEIERLKLIQCIQKEEENIDCLIKNFTGYDKLKPEVIQQQLAHEQLEHEHLLEITRQNYDNVKKTDILKSMQQLLEEKYVEGKYMGHYKDNLNNVKQNLLVKESEIECQLEQLLNTKDQSKEALVRQLLEDQNFQKAMVSSLLDQVDARSWSLNQEISLISSHLAKLSIIEQEKRKMQIMYNYNDLLNQRIHLVHLLDDLYEQKNKRKVQLLETLNEAENESNFKTEFWLRSYKKLLDAAPRSLLKVGKTLDPLLANFLLQEGVIHCLPFLVKFLFYEKSLSSITNQDLIECGVTLTKDRENILKAVNEYLSCKKANFMSNINGIKEEPSAPQIPDETQLGVVDVENADDLKDIGECVICMEKKSEVVFVPCGHMCCCQICSQKDISLCPMCRSGIERRIKVLVA